MESVGDYYKQNELQRTRRDLLAQLQEIDQIYASKLAGVEFTDEALENIATLAEYLWDIDDQITKKCSKARSFFAKPSPAPSARGN